MAQKTFPPSPRLEFVGVSVSDSAEGHGAEFIAPVACSIRIVELPYNLFLLCHFERTVNIRFCNQGISVGEALGRATGLASEGCLIRSSERPDDSFRIGVHHSD